MNETKNLELFYILPYTQNFSSGGHYYNEDSGCVDYKPASIDNWNDSPLIFDKKEELLNWFIKNDGKPIPIVYRIKYLENYQGVDDVIKVTNLKNGKTNYYTALSKDEYAWYKEDDSKLYNKIIWDYMYSDTSYEDKAFWLDFDYIYEEIRKRGIEIKYDVYRKDIDRKKCFDFVGDPFYRENSEKAKSKNLILYRHDPRNCW